VSLVNDLDFPLLDLADVDVDVGEVDERGGFVLYELGEVGKRLFPNSRLR